MKAVRLILPVALALISSVPAFALKMESRLTPQNLDNSGFTVQAERREKGNIAFTITRDLAKSPIYAPTSTIEIRRYADFKVYDKTGLVAACPVAPEQQGNRLTYSFTVGADYAANAHFTLAEVDDYKDHTQQMHLLGGGSFYEFQLADFVATAPATH